MSIPKWITSLEVEEERGRAFSIYVEYENAKAIARRARESGHAEVERRYSLAMRELQENYRDAKEDLLAPSVAIVERLSGGDSS